ncbi:MAG: hypothetical protein WDA27_02645 [Actinomycetota bacterium]
MKATRSPELPMPMAPLVRAAVGEMVEVARLTDLLAGLLSAATGDFGGDRRQTASRNIGELRLASQRVRASARGILAEWYPGVVTDEEGR